MNRLKEDGQAWHKKQKDICSELGLPNIVKENIGKSKWESMVKKAVREVHERELKEIV